MPELKCPNCGASLEHAFEGKLDDMLANRPIHCPGCGIEIRLRDEDRRAIKRALEDFKRSLRRFGR